MMLHGSYMSIEKKVNVDGSYQYQPKSTLRRYSIFETGILESGLISFASRRRKKQGHHLYHKLRTLFEHLGSI
jgi:hypothetical protein